MRAIVSGDLAVRAATADDYEAFCRLFPELATGDAVPSREAWTDALSPSTWMATLAGESVGYCYFQELGQTGYVRHIVAAPATRRKGVGRALMQATADHLRSRGKRTWELNVKPDNRSAIALYEQFGLRARYESRALQFPWRALDGLPPGSATVRELTAERYAAVESLFELPDGQLSQARNHPRILLEAQSSSGGQTLGISVFDPTFPGAFPFRVKDLEAVQPLLLAMREHVPSDEHVNIVVENDPRLSARLERAGATVRLEFLHMEGHL